MIFKLAYVYLVHAKQGLAIFLQLFLLSKILSKRTKTSCMFVLHFTELSFFINSNEVNIP